MTHKIYQERLRKSNRLVKAAGPDVLLQTKPANIFCLTGDGRLCAYAKTPQEGKVALGDPQTDVKDVKSLAHFEAENIYPTTAPSPALQSRDKGALRVNPEQTPAFRPGNRRESKG